MVFANRAHVRQVHLEDEVKDELLCQLEFDQLHVGDGHDSQQYNVQDGLLYFQDQRPSVVFIH